MKQQFKKSLVALAVSAMMTTGAMAQNIGFEDGTATGWSGNGISAVGTQTLQAGSNQWTINPYGSYMGKLTITSGSFSQMTSALNLTQASASGIQSTLSTQAQLTGNGGGNPTTASWASKTVTLTAGQTFTLAWQYISTDYVPFNDGSIATLVKVDNPSVTAVLNNYTSQYALLGFTNPGTGDYSTGSYGATGWQTATYTVTESGDYLLGFGVFNLDDTALSPVLYVDEVTGSTLKNGQTFGAVAPNPGTSAPDTSSGSVTPPPPPPPPPGPTLVTNVTGTTGSDMLDAGSITVNGGTIQIMMSGATLTQLFDVQGTATFDQNSNTATVSGVISGTGDVVIANSGSGGSITFTAVNTYTGSTTINSGATLINDGSIASSSGTTNLGTFTNNGTAGSVVNGFNGDGNTAVTNNNGTVGTVTNWSTFNNNTGATTGTVTNFGTFENSGTTGTFNNAGTLNNNTGGVVSELGYNNNWVSNSGTINTITYNGGTVNNNNGGIIGTINTVEAHGTFNNDGTVTGTVTTNGTFNNNAGGVVQGLYTNDGTLTNNGTVANVVNNNTFTNNNIAGDVTNSGTFDNTGTAGTVTLVNGTFTNTGTVASVDNTAGLTVTNSGNVTGLVNNAGTFTNEGNIGSVTNTGWFTNVLNAITGYVTNSNIFTNNGTTGGVSNTGTFTNNGATSDVNNSNLFTNNGTTGAVTNTGTFTNAGTTGDVTNANLFANSGQVGTVNNTGTFNQTGGASTLINNAGTGTVNLSGGTADIVNAGIVNQSGGSAGTVTNNGVYSVTGGSISSITNTNVLNLTGAGPTVALGSYTQSTTGSTYINGNQQVTVSGTANLAGDLNINGAPTAYGKYTYLTAGTVAGQYDTLTLNPDLYPLGYGLVYTGNSITLKVTPSASYTMAAVNTTAGNLASVANLQAGSLGGTLNYDCNLFGENGMCVSTGVRTTSDSAGSIKGGNFIIGKRINDNWRAGMFVDQSIGNTTVGNVTLAANPAIGGFANWNEDARGYGWGVQTSAAVSTGSLDINRAGSPYSEATTGKSSSSGKALQVKTTYAMPVTTRDTVTPYAGLRYTSINNSGYTEQGAVFPITYGNTTQSATDAVAGISLSHNFGRVTGSITTGVIQNLSYSAGTLTGTSEIVGLSSINTKLPGSGYTSLSLGTGVSYDLAKNQYIGASVGWQQKSLLNTSILSGAVTYTVGF